MGGAKSTGATQRPRSQQVRQDEAHRKEKKVEREND